MSLRLSAALVILLLPLPAGAHAADNDHERVHNKANAQLAEKVAREIHKVLPFGRDSFRLGFTRPGVFSLYGDRVNVFWEIKCERSVAFSMIINASEMGSISIGSCGETASALRRAAMEAEQRLQETLHELSLDAGEQNLERTGWSYAHTTLPDGSEFYYFPIVVVGHGVLRLSTVVLFGRDANTPLLIQIDANTLCSNYPDARLCKDTKGVLQELGSGLMKTLIAP